MINNLRPLLEVIQDGDSDVEFDKQQAKYETPINIVSSKIPGSNDGNTGDRMVVNLSNDSFLYIKVKKNKWMKITLEEL